MRVGRQNSPEVFKPAMDWKRSLPFPALIGTFPTSLRYYECDLTTLVAGNVSGFLASNMVYNKTIYCLTEANYHPIKE